MDFVSSSIPTPIGFSVKHPVGNKSVAVVGDFDGNKTPETLELLAATLHDYGVRGVVYDLSGVKYPKTKRAYAALLAGFGDSMESQFSEPDTLDTAVSALTEKYK